MNQVSYAMMGLQPQMHRYEITTAGVVARLLKKKYGIDYTTENIPCK
ncbi:MAG: hypothetical protein SGI83_08640 [Bacteroidota bacterium]|nr:hypothetical protein [Bacteroidota bacterium]